MNLNVSLSDVSSQVGGVIRERLKETVADLTSDVAAAAKGNLRETTHRSQPGEAPDDAHGALTDSIAVQVGESQGEVTVGAPFAAYLELGTVKIAPRPFLLPAANQVFDKAEEGLTLGI